MVGTITNLFSLNFPDDTQLMSHKTWLWTQPTLSGYNPGLSVIKLTEILKYVKRVMKAWFMLSVIIADSYSKLMLNINIEGVVL